MNYFESQLAKILLESNYVSPDHLWNGQPDKTFIYITTTKKLTVTDGRTTHYNMIRADFETYLEALANSGEDEDEIESLLHYHNNKENRFSMAAAMKMRHLIERIAIIGRTGQTPDYDAYFIATWNDDPGMYGDDIDDCIEALFDSGLDTDGKKVYLSTPTQGIIEIVDGDTEPEHQELSDQEKEQIRLQKELHLMNPSQKKKAMAALGLADRNKKHPIQHGLEQSHMINPGDKWWAMNSESTHV